MKGINFEDKNIKFVLLPIGRYLIDGEVLIITLALKLK